MSYIGNTQQNQSYVPAVDFFSGNGSTTAFTLSKPVATTAQIQAVISNVPQTPGVAYTVSGSTITFTSAPPSGTNNIYVYYTSPNTQVVQPGQGTVGTAQLQSDLTLTNPTYTGTLTGGTGVVNIGSGQVYKDSSGNVAIGTTNTSGFKFSVGTGSIVAQNNSSNLSGFYLGTYSDIAISYTYLKGDGRSTGYLAAYTNDTERMRIDSSGNVGIGTSSPSQKLHVYNSASATAARFQTTSAAATIIEFADNGTTVAPNIGCRGNSISFGTDSSERMRIDSSGNLLVGTTNTSLWTASSNTTADNGFAYSNGYVVGSQYNGNAALFNRTGSDGAIVSFYRSGTTKGNISITTSAVAYNTTSDYRLKENIQPMQNALGVVAQLNPVTYTWKANGSDGQGFIAHELQAVVPDCVTGEKDAVDEDGNPVYQGIDTSFLVATLTKAIQELNAKVDAQAAEIAALKGQA